MANEVQLIEFLKYINAEKNQWRKMFSEEINKIQIQYRSFLSNFDSLPNQKNLLRVNQTQPKCQTEMPSLIQSSRKISNKSTSPSSEKQEMKSLFIT